MNAVDAADLEACWPADRELPEPAPRFRMILGVDDQVREVRFLGPTEPNPLKQRPHERAEPVGDGRFAGFEECAAERLRRVRLPSPGERGFTEVHVGYDLFER